MFAVYKKIISPESSPVLCPASPNLAPMTNVNNATNGTNDNNNGAMESLSLCNYCCSPRNKLKKDDAPKVQDPEQYTSQPKYEFGHATHYIYGITTPRLLCDFETGTPPSP